MNTNIRQINLPQAFQLRSAAPSVGRFLWHFVQMVVAMEVGMMIYHMLLRPVLAPLGLSALTATYPLIGYWLMVVSMVLGMLALMRYQRSTWRYCGEMTLAMIAPLAVLTVLGLCSLLPIHTLYALGDPLMFVAMAAFMVYRPHEHAHSGHQHAVLPQAETGQECTHES